MILHFILAYVISGGGFYLLSRLYKKGHLLNFMIVLITLGSAFPQNSHHWPVISLLILPLLLIVLLNYGLQGSQRAVKLPSKYKVDFSLESGQLQIKNLRRGVSITGSAGSGKTESVVYNFLKHLRKHDFCGIIHDYKNFELTELAFPFYKKSEVPFYIISFDPVYHHVNPIAPHYMQDEESVNEVARVLMENLLEQKDQYASSTTRFFNDAVEGILSGMIWKLRTYHPEFCTLPHLIALYQLMTSDQLIHFLSSDFTSRAMADAFISEVDSERQTAAVKGTLGQCL